MIHAHIWKKKKKKNFSRTKAYGFDNKIGALGQSKFVQIMTLELPLRMLRQGQIFIWANVFV